MGVSPAGTVGYRPAFRGAEVRLLLGKRFYF
jgi:hypothetical protein